MHSTLALLLFAAPFALGSGIIQRRNASESPFQAAQESLQSFVSNATTVVAAGNCTTPCKPYLGILQGCVDNNGGNLAAIGVCACQRTTLADMATCGTCINDTDAVTEFSSVCQDLKGGAISNGTSSSAASAAASATSRAAASATSRAASVTSAAASAAATTSGAASSGSNSYVKGGLVAILASVAGLMVI